MTDGARFSSDFVEDVRARTSMVSLIGQSVALKQKGGRWWGLCPFHKEKTPSFTVNEAQATYHCFGCGEHGDCFGWLKARHDLDFLAAVEELAIRAGLVPDRAGRAPLSPAPIVDRPDAEDQKRERQEKIAWARGLWASGVAATGTAVETYLAARGIDLDSLPAGIPPTLRFHPALKHSDSGQVFPAMLGAFQDPSRRLTGIHRTFLSPSGMGKAPVKSQKKMGGVCWGAAIRLCPAAADMGLAEGIETSLSVMSATGLPVWAAGSLGNMAAVDFPPVVKTLLLCLDNDGDADALDQTVAKAIAFHAARGRLVKVARPPVGMDFNDLLTREVVGA